MPAKMDAATFGKGIELVNNMTKLATNLSSDKPRAEKKTFKEGDSTSQPHNQTVEVKVGAEQPQKPYVIHEKKETHIHKPFPEGRELSKQECEVETLRLQLDAEDKKAEREYRMWLEEENRKERKEREEYARRERERKRQEDKKFAKRMFIGMGIAGAIGLGIAGYDYYTSTLRSAGRRLVIPAQTQVTPPIKTEGSVE